MESNGGTEPANYTRIIIQSGLINEIFYILKKIYDNILFQSMGLILLIKIDNELCIAKVRPTQFYLSYLRDKRKTKAKDYFIKPKMY